MTDHELSTLLRGHVQEQEPPFALSAETSMALGRRTLVRRRARRGFAGVLVAAAAVVAVPMLPWGGSHGSGDDRTGIDPATAHALAHYDAQAMPGILEEHTRATLGAGLDGLGPAAFRAADSQGNALTPKYYDKASSMAVTYGAEGGDRRVSVSLMHARSEAEGGVRKNCDRDLAAGYDLSCEVTTSGSGDLVTTRVMAVRPIADFPDGTLGVVTREELRTGVTTANSPGGSGPIDPDEIYFQRIVEVVHSESFLTTATETVKAPDLRTANQLWRLPVDAFTTIVTDPVLVIPEPPIGPDGCPWTLPDSDVSCAK